MNSNGLARHYDKLTPRERLPLILAADARGDETEVGRLVSSAPAAGYRLRDFHGLGQALDRLAAWHLLELLDLAAVYWQVLGAHAVEGSPSRGKEAEAGRNHLGGKVKLAAYLFTARLDGWRQFCCGLNIDPEHLLAALPGYEMLTRTEGAARGMAFTQEEASGWLRHQFADAAPPGATLEPEVVTADGVALELAETLDGLAARWE
jgi:hypothetical protein